MLTNSDLIAFASSTDLARTQAFYRTVLGLELVEQSPYACVFDAHGTMLRITSVAEVARPGYTVLGWRVADIDKAVAGLATLGVDFVRYDGMEQDGQGIWTTPNGDRVAWFADPDGNLLSLTEFR